MKTTVRIRRRHSHPIPGDFPAEIHPVIAQIYASRGVVSYQEVTKILAEIHSYKDLSGMAAAVALLEDVLDRKQKILVLGDFDADGATSSALAVRVLRQLGANVDYLVPNRFLFGYGLTPEIVAVAADQRPDLIITVDNGISSITGVEAAQSRGIKVLVTDHHLPGTKLPTADAIVNPNQPGDHFASKNLAGVGVIFYVLVALRASLRDKGWFAQQQIAEPNMAQYLDLVALGTVADVVPLDANNRVLIAQGLARIQAGKCIPGITALLKLAKRDTASISAADLGFAVGPRLNAAGRMEDMSIGVECLLADDVAVAEKLAMQLDDLNKERRQIEQQMKNQAIGIIEKIRIDQKKLPMGLCLYDESWHEGVIGIVASRVKDSIQRPVIAFARGGATSEADQKSADTFIKGSARSVAGVHIRDILETIAAQKPEILQKFGGHAMAAGMTIKLKDLAQFSLLFDKAVSKKLSAEDCESIIHSDGSLTEHNLNLDFAALIKQAGPWGQGFPEPIFDGIFQIIDRRVVGGSHLKLVLAAEGGFRQFDAIAFNATDENWPGQVKQVRLAYKLDINHFRGATQLQLMVEYIEPMAS